jgi:hypothetical protein
MTTNCIKIPGPAGTYGQVLINVNDSGSGTANILVVPLSFSNGMGYELPLRKKPEKSS